MNEHQPILCGLFWVALNLGLAQAQAPVYPQYRVEQGETRYLAGSHVFSSMVIYGTLILTGDTVVTLMGPAIEESETHYPNLVFYLKYPAKIENEPHTGPAGVRGRHGREAPYDPNWSAQNGYDSDFYVRTDPPGDGTNGKRGYDGRDGTAGGDGWPGPSFVVQARGGGAYINGSIELLGSVAERGGYGGDATNGGYGGRGGYSQFLEDGRGGDGGPGGNAGHGGRGGGGGNGGTFKLAAQGMVYLYGSITVNAGNGGPGGAAGEAGNGGGGGDGGLIGVAAWGGGDGTPGRGSDAGFGGTPGNGGNGGQGGAIDIYAKEDIWYLGSPLLAARGGRGGDRGANGAGGGNVGLGGHYRVSDDTFRGPSGTTGWHLPDIAGRVGFAGAGGEIRLLTRGSLKPYGDNLQYFLYLDAGGGEGGRPGRMDDASATGNPSPPPATLPLKAHDGKIPGGDGGMGGQAEIKAKGSARVRIRLNGGPGNFGADGQYNGLESSNGARGGNGGNGGQAEVISPIIHIDPATEIAVNGGLPGKGGYPGSYGIEDAPLGEWGPWGQPGQPGKYTLTLADPAFFPQTSALTVASKPEDKAPVGKIVTYQYQFTNDDPESPIKKIKLLVNWDSPYCEPISCDLGGARSGRGFIAFPSNLAEGQTLTWNFSVKILPPFYPNVTIPCNVEIHGEIADSPGEDFAILTLPMAPQEGFWYDIVPAKGCGRPGAERAYQVVWKNTNSEDAFSGVSIALGSLPPGVSLASGAASWDLGTVAPGASGSESFSVLIANPWNFDAWGDHFKIDGTASAAELESALPLDSIHDVWIGQLGLTVTNPAAEIEYRGNRMPAAGFVSDCTDSLEPGDVAVYFTTQGNDADTGALLTRKNDAVPLAGLAFDTEDGARLVAAGNTMSGVAETDAGLVTVGPIGAISVFYRVVHDIFEGSLPRLGRYGLPSSGQKTRLDEWKADYADISQDLALRKTDAVERLDAINDIGIIAQTVANAHYSEIAEGVQGVISVWDLVALASMGVSKQLLQQNRILGAILGGETGRLAALTGEGCDQLTNRALPSIAKKIGLNKILSNVLQSKQMKKYLAQYSDDIVTQMYYSAKWQLFSGKMLKLWTRNINSPTQQQESMQFGVYKYQYEIPVDPAIQGGLEILLKMIVEPFIHGSVAMGQERMLGLSFSGSQDLALATAQNVKMVLQTMSGIALRWGDLNNELHDVSVAARDSLMWIEMIPLGATQKAAGVAWKVADVTGRVGAAMKVRNHADFLQQVAAITAAGVQSVVEGNLDAFGYPIESGNLPQTQGLGRKAAKEGAFKPAASDHATSDVLSLYEQIETAARANDVSGMADAAEILVPLYRDLLTSETLLDIRADVLINPPPDEFAGGLDVEALAREYQYGALETAMQRMALLRLMGGLGVGPDDEILTNLLATLDRLRLLERQTAAAGEEVQAVLESIDLPDLPVMVLIDAPMAAETGTTLTVSVTLANVGWGDSTTGTITLALPEGLGEPQPSQSQEVAIAGGPVTVQWQLLPTQPGTYTEDFAIHLYAEDGMPIDLHNLILSVDEAGARLDLESGQGGGATTALGSGSLTVPTGAFDAQGGGVARMSHGDVVVQLLPVEGIHPQPGVLFIGGARYLVLALDPADGTTVSLTGSAPTLTLHWNEGDVPAWIESSQLKMMMSGGDGRWSALVTGIDAGQRAATAPIPGCGWYAIGVIDDEPPPAPGDLRAETGAGGLLLGWQPVVAPDLTGYEIDVYEGADLVRCYAVADPARTTFDVEDYTANAPRRYAIRAVDAAGNVSAESNSVTVMIPSGGGPVWRMHPLIDSVVPGGVALYDVEATNPDSTAIDVRLAVVERPERCVWRFEPAALRLPPGSTRVFRLAVGADPFAPRGDHKIVIEATAGGSVRRIECALHISAEAAHNLASYAAGGRIQACSSPADGAAGSPALLIDEDAGSAWRTGHGRIANEWVKLSLAGGEVYSIDRIVVRPVSGGGNSPAEFEIQVSDTTLDDDAFTTRVVAGQFGPGATALEFTFDAVRARHIRLRCLNAQADSDWIELAELEVYGQPETRNGDWGMLMDHLLGRRPFDATERDLCDFNDDGRLDIGDLVNLVNRTVRVFGL